MRLGLCTTDFLPDEARRIYEKLQALGCQVAQINFSAFVEADYIGDGQFEIPERIQWGMIRQIQRLSEAYCVQTVAINGTFNMAHPDPQVRQEGLSRLYGLMDRALDLGCPVLTLCTGSRNRGHLWQTHPENTTDQAWTDMRETVSLAVEAAEKKGVTLALETEAANVVDSPQKARQLLGEINSPKLKIIMDCANLFHKGQAKVENVASVITEAFDLLGKDILLAHGKDIRQSEGIEFCATGEGIIDYSLFIRLLKQVGYTGDMLLHGIYEEQKMPLAMGYMRQVIAQA